MSTLDPPFPELANRTYITRSWGEFENMTKYDVFEKVSVLFMFIIIHMMFINHI